MVLNLKKDPPPSDKDSEQKPAEAQPHPSQAAAKHPPQTPGTAGGTVPAPGEEVKPQAKYAPTQGGGVPTQPGRIAPLQGHLQKMAERKKTPAELEEEAKRKEAASAVKELKTEKEGGEEGKEEAETETIKPGFSERLNNFIEKTSDFVDRHKQGVKVGSISITVIVVVALIAAAVYKDILYTLAINAYEEGDCGQSAALLEQYRSNYEFNEKVGINLAQSHACLRRINDASAVLSAMEVEFKLDSNAEFWFLKGQVGLHDQTEENIEILADIERAIAADAGFLPAYYLLAYYYIATDNSSGVEFAFRDMQDLVRDLSPEDRARFRPMINAARRNMQDAFNYEYTITLPLAYTNAEDAAVPPVFGVRFPASGFHNLYEIPLGAESVLDDDVSGRDNIFLLRALTLMDEDKAEEAYDFLAESRTERSKLSEYVKAFLLMQLGDYQAAANVYKGLAADGENKAQAMFVNVQWMLGAGANPSAELLAAAETAHTNNEGWQPTANNLAYLKIYSQDTERARSLLEDLYSTDPNYIYSLVNLALLDIVEDSADKTTEVYIDAILGSEDDEARAQAEAAAVAGEQTEVYIDAILDKKNKLTDETTLYHIFSRFLAARGKYEKALGIFDDLKESNPENFAYFVDAGEAHEMLEQPILAVEEFQAAYDIAPDEELVWSKLLLAKVRYESKSSFDNFYNSLGINDSAAINNPYVGLALALSAPNATQANRRFEQALNNAENQSDAELIVDLWTRHELSNENLSAAQAVLTRAADRLESGLSAGLQALNARVNILQTNVTPAQQVEIKQRADEMIQYIDKLPTSAKIDLGWVYLTLNDLRQVILLAEDIQAPAALALLKSVYEKRGNRDKLAEVEAKLDIIANPVKDEEEELIGEDGETPTNVVRELGSRSLFAKAGANEVLQAIDRAIQENDLPRAIEIYTEILNGEIETLKLRSPAISYQNRGVLYLRTNQFENAAGDFRQALNIGGLEEAQQEALLYNHAHATFNLKNYGASLKSINEILEITPDNINALNFLGQIQLAMNNADAAVETYQQVIDTDRRVIAAYVNMAIAFRKLREPEKAIDILNDALLVNDKHPRIHKELSSTYILLGNLAKADEHRQIFRALGGTQN